MDLEHGSGDLTGLENAAFGWNYTSQRFGDRFGKVIGLGDSPSYALVGDCLTVYAQPFFADMRVELFNPFDVLLQGLEQKSEICIRAMTTI